MVQVPQIRFLFLILMGTKQFGKLFFPPQNLDSKAIIRNFSWKIEVIPLYFVFTFYLKFATLHNRRIVKYMHHPGSENINIL